MKNRMFQQYGQRQPNQQRQIQNGGGFQQKFNSMEDFVNKYNEFSRNFQGSPEQKLQEMLNSGQMTQEQYDMLYGLASKITGR